MMPDSSASSGRTALREWVITALFAALLCVCAPFSIPVGPVPVTLATLALYVISLMLRPKNAFVAVLLYVCIGAVGVPVFSGFTGGFDRILGVTGGYIAGYPVCALIASILSHLSLTRWRFPFRVLGMLSGTIVLYAIGSLWFMVSTGNDLASTLMLCVIPFLLGDALKMIFAFLLTLALEKPLASLLPDTRTGKGSSPRPEPPDPDPADRK